MESNRDEAERCIQIASKAMCDGKFEKAEKFLLKAETLYPTKEAKVLLEKLTQTNKSNLNNENEAKFDGTHRRKSTPSTQQKQQKDQQSSSEPEYTKDQLEHVKRIRKCKDYYEVLGVTKESPDSEIKKAYKKLALQLHPDKNNAPGSAEAFKAIGNAATVLTDPEKRKQYDAYGAEGLNGQMGRAGRGYGVNRGFEGFDGFTFSRGFESNATAEEIFNMFFGGGADTFSQGNVYRRQNRYQRTENARNEPQSNYTALINLAPILLLILLPMLTSFFTSDPIYTLQPSQKYTIRRQTNNLKVMYYVKDNFHVEYQGSVGRLEASVEEEYIQNLKHACYRERNYKEAMLMKARNFGDRELYKRSQTITTPSCEALHKIH